MTTGGKKQYRGAFEHVLDEKSRVTIPSKWRDALGEKIVLCRSLNGTNCIWGFADADFTEFFDDLGESIGLGDAEGQKQYRLLSSSVSEVEVDKQGRVPLSEKLRDHAVIAPDTPDPRGFQVKFVGMRSRFEIWNPKLCEESQVGVQTESLLVKLDQFQKKDKAE